MNTATTVKTDWKKKWQDFYDCAFSELWDNSEVSQAKILTRLQMLKNTDEIIDEILEKFDEMGKILPDMTQVAHVLHQFLDFKDNYRSLSFEISIDENTLFTWKNQKHNRRVVSTMQS